MTTEIKYHTKEEALAAVTQDGDGLKFCTQELQNDEEVVLAAIRKNEWSFQYASDTLKNNKNFILKALNDGVDPCGLALCSTKSIKSDIEVMTLAIEKDIKGFVFACAIGELTFNKELAAKALIKYENRWGSNDSGLWTRLPLPLQEFFPKESWYKKAKVYLCQLEQWKQAELVSGGSTAEDGVVW